MPHLRPAVAEQNPRSAARREVWTTIRRSTVRTVDSFGLAVCFAYACLEIVTSYQKKIRLQQSMRKSMFKDQSSQISSRSDLKRRSFRLFKRPSPQQAQEQTSSDMGSGSVSSKSYWFNTSHVHLLYRAAVPLNQWRHWKHAATENGVMLNRRRAVAFLADLK